MRVPRTPIDDTRPPAFSLSLLGHFELTGPHGVIELRSRKLAGLLAHLACSARPQSRETLMALLWGSHFDLQARQNLRQALSRLRKVLGPDALQSDDEVVSLNVAAVSCDVGRFEALARQDSREALGAAADLYRGRLVDDLAVDEEVWNEWLAGERGRLSELALGVLVRLGEQELGAGRAVEALQAGRRAVALNSLREDAHRLIVQALAATGRQAEALRHYQELVALLKRELNTEPDAATRLLVSELRAAQSPAGSPAVADSAKPTRPQPDRPSISPVPAQITGRAEGRAERRHLTILACTMVDDGALSSHLDPEHMHDLIASFNGMVAEAVSRFDGFVAQYTSGGVLVYFGYPVAGEHDTEQAVRAGLALHDAIAALNATQQATAGIRLHARVGIATGLVVVGEPLGSGAGEHIAIGEAPDLAARLQAVASPGEVVVAAATHRLVGRMFDCRALEADRLPGLPPSAEAWRVLGEAAGVSRFAARRAGMLSPLVGRQEEIDLLLRRWDQARRGEGRVVLLSGEPGIGKSRIAESLLAALDGASPACLRYFCSPHHAHSPLYPFITQLEQTASFEPGSSPGAKLDRLKALLEPTSQDLPRDLALIADLLSVPTEGRTPDLVLSPSQKRELTLAALLDQLDGRAALAPVLIVFEDIHWIDPTSQDLLDRMVARVGGLPVLLVATLRPERASEPGPKHEPGDEPRHAPTWLGQPQVTLWPLSRLGRRESAALMAGVAGDKPLPDAVVEQVLAHADGVPLFIEELTRTLLESGLLRETAERHVLDGPLPSLAVPTTLQASLVARLDRLGPAKDVAQIGAAIGREFSHELMAAVADVTVSDGARLALDAELDRLTASGLVSRRGTRPDATYSFKHALVQDVAYSTMLRNRRRELHATIAKVLVEQFAATAESLPGVVARHYADAGRPGEAITYWLKAGRLALARSANREAVASFEQALNLLLTMPETSETLQLAFETRMGLWSALQPLNDRARIEEHLHEAEVLARNLGSQPHRVPVLMLQANQCQASGDYAEAARLGQEALIVARALGDRMSEALVLLCNAQTHVVRGELGEAAVVLERLVAPEATAGVEWPPMTAILPPALAEAFLGEVLSQFGRFDEAMAHAEAAQRIVAAADHPVSQYFVWLDRGRLHMRRGDLARATAVLERCLDHCRTRQIAVGIPLTSAALGQAYALAGRAGEALPLIDVALAEFRDRPRHVRPAFILLCAGTACLAAGRIDEAAGHAREALALSRRLGARASEAHALCLAGDVLAGDGASAAGAADAAAYFREGLTLAGELGMRPLAAHCHLGLSRCEPAPQHLATAVTLYRDMGMTHWLPAATARPVASGR